MSSQYPGVLNTPIQREQARVYENVRSVTIKTVERGALSVLYGVGIAGSVAISKIPHNSDSYDVPNAINTEGYGPDAPRDGKGGYISSSRWDGYMSSSLIGMPVLCYAKFRGGVYTDLQGNQQTIPDIIFENILMTVTMNKNIVKEGITGRDSGTIKEYIGMGDWNVEARIVISADAPVNSSVQKRIQTGVYPRDNMREVMRLLTAPIALPVECWYLQQFGIDYLVVDSGVQIDQIETEYSVQRIVVPFISDRPLVITVKS